MNENDINDIRVKNDFKGITFSEYKKSDVKKELLNCLSKSKVEAACNWCGELICAGHYSDLWEAILLFLGKCIHLGNPLLPIYIEMRFNNFREIVNNGYVDNELAMRNNKKIRELFCEIIVVLCVSNKKPSFEIIKINKAEEFNLTNLSSKFKAPTIRYGNKVFKSNDPKELFVPINELSFHLEQKNLLQSCYWIEWIMEYDSICKKEKTPLQAERRTFAPVSDKNQLDCIWIIWDLLLLNTPSKLVTRILNSLLNLFALRFTSACKKKRRYLLYFAVQLITEKANLNIEIISSNNKTLVKNVTTKIDTIYKSIKKNEKAPETDYLFNGIKKEKSNLEKTIEKLDTLNKFNKFGNI